MEYGKQEKFKRHRVSVPVTQELDQKLDRVSKRLSISKSSLCAVLISHGVIQKENELDLMSVDNLNKVMQEQMKGLKND